MKVLPYSELMDAIRGSKLLQVVMRERLHEVFEATGAHLTSCEFTSTGIDIVFIPKEPLNFVPVTVGFDIRLKDNGGIDIYDGRSAR